MRSLFWWSVIIVSIGLLASLVESEPAWAPHEDEASIARSECRTIQGQASFFRRGLGQLPTLDDLFEQDGRGRAFVESVGKNDPWGTPYLVRPVDEYRVEVISAGPDTLEDTDDDIVYPDRDRDH
ncbi:MAG: type II secretion system protein GspG [Planctomycetota bacterium]